MKLAQTAKWRYRMWPVRVRVRATINRSRDVTSDFGSAVSRHETRTTVNCWTDVQFAVQSVHADEL